MRRSISAVATLVFAFVLSFGVSVAAADPPVVTLNYTWDGTSPNETDLSNLTWVNSGSSDFMAVDECDSGLFGSCDVFPGAFAPMVSADPSGTYNDGEFAGWNFQVPGGPDAYIEHVVAEGINVTGPDELNLENDGPTAFLGLWDGTDFLTASGSPEPGPIELDEDGEPGVNQVIFGLGGDNPFTEEHWAGLRSIEVTLGDDVDPVATIDAPTGWVDEDDTTIPVEAEDDGLGLVWVIYRSVKRNPANLFDFYTAGQVVCQSFFDNEGVVGKELCPRETPSGFHVPLIPTALKEGYTNLHFSTADLHDNNDEQVIPIKIDTQQPSVSLGGSFTTAPGMVLDGALYELEVDAADGNATVHNSGVKKIQVLVDNVEIDSDTQACPGDDCEMELDTDIEPDNWANGEHQLKVKVTDQVGHVKTTTVDFEVDR